MELIYEGRDGIPSSFTLDSRVGISSVLHERRPPDRHKYFTKHLPLKQAQPIMYPIIPRTHFIVRYRFR